MKLKQIFLLFNTIKYLRIIQLTNRTKRIFFKPKPKLNISFKISKVDNPVKPFVRCKQKIIDRYQFKFLNKEAYINSSNDWNSPKQEKLWLYNLHYFDDLISINSKKRTNLHIDLIQKWIDENEYGYGNGWEPYPTSLRIVNWIKWSLEDNQLKDEWLDSLASQVDFLTQNIEYHLLGNHLFSNAKALIFAGLYFRGPFADKCYRLGLKICRNEISEQILFDGGNFELSPMYHMIFVEDLLDIINIHQVYSKSLPNGLIKKTKKMLYWIMKMCHPDGGISFFNDSAHGVSSELKDLVNYFNLLKIDVPLDDECQLTHFEESGYIRAQNKKAVLIADIAKIGPDYLPAHGHADALSFELSLFGQRAIVNSGTSTYELGEERDLQRGTNAHSTISIDGINSSEVWGGFRVAKRAKIFNISKLVDGKDIKFSACHNGYKRINKNIIHCREWTLSDNFLEIIDDVSGSNNHTITSILPLHPDVQVSKVFNDSVEIKIRDNKIKIKYQGLGKIFVKEAYYYPEFGLSIKNKQIIYNYNGSLPIKTNINISW